MAKNTGPYFEFVLNKDGARVEYTFLPGNVSKKVFEGTRDALTQAFRSQYGVSTSDYLRETELDNGTKTISIYQTKVIVALKAILGGNAFRDFKIKFTGVNKNGDPETVVLNNTVEANQATKLIPYFNKNNNDLTTRRAK